MTQTRDVSIDLGPGRRVHCVETGEGPAVVFFPGNGCSVEDMAPLIPRIGSRFRFVGIDPPGRQPTDWPDEEFDFLKDLPPLIDRVLAEMRVAPHVAMGHSMGGMLALQHANRNRHAVKGLVLFEGFVTLKIHAANAAPNGLRPIRMSPDIAEAFRRRQAANQYWLETHPRFRKSFWASQQAHDARPWVGGLNLPILVFIGENGQCLPSDLQAWRNALGMEAVADLAVVAVPRSGHWMMLDDPEAVGEVLMPFLEGRMSR